MSISIFRKIAIVGIVLTALLGIGFFATSDVSPVQTPIVEAFGGGGGDGCGGCGGGDDGGGDPNPDPDPVDPIACTLIANPNTIDKGDSSTLSWTTNNAYTVSINQGIGAVAVGSGQKLVSPNQTTTYTMTVQNIFGQTANCSSKVTVIQPAPVPTCDALYFDPNPVEKGDLTDLVWETSHASKVTLKNLTSGQSFVVKADGSWTDLDFYQDQTYNLTVEGADGSTDVCETTLTVNQPAPGPDPECTLSAQTSTIDKGDNSTLTWTTTNATKVSINQGIGSVSLDGSKTVSPNQTITYTLTAENSDGDKVNCSAKVTVVQPAPDPECTLNASLTTVTKGDSTELSWTTKNAWVVALNPGFGSVQKNGSVTVSPDRTTTYTLTVNQEGRNAESVDCTVKIIVSDTPTTPDPECTLSAQPSTIDKGDNSTLTWTTTNATKVSINQGIGSVSLDGSKTVSPNQTITYTLTAENSDGDKVNCSAKVTVIQPTPDPITCEDNVHLSANPSNIKKGESTELKWTTSGITSVSINQGIGSVALDGSKTVSPSSDITYTLTASDGDDTISCPVSVDVESGGGGGTLYPRCELDISDENISEGQSITLEWDSRYATDIEITDDRGNIIVTTHDRLADDKRDFFDGDKKLRPTRDTTYTMVAERGGREDDCEVSVEVEDDIVVIEDRDQKPLVSGIALTHVPYTGFEAGPMLTMLFYTLLTLWALFVAYVYIMRRGKAVEHVAATGMYTPVSVQRAVNPDLFSSHGEKTGYTAAAANTATSLPRLCPDSSAPVGWNTTESAVAEDEVQTETATGAEFTQLESQAHDKQVLISQDALVQFMDVYGNGQNEMFDTILDYARSMYTNESGWVVLNTARMHELLQSA